MKSCGTHSMSDYNLLFLLRFLNIQISLCQSIAMIITLLLRQSHSSLSITLTAQCLHIAFILHSKSTAIASTTLLYVSAMDEDIRCHYIRTVKVPCRWIASLYPL